MFWQPIINPKSPWCGPTAPEINEGPMLWWIITLPMELGISGTRLLCSSSSMKSLSGKLLWWDGLNTAHELNIINRMRSKTRVPGHIPIDFSAGMKPMAYVLPEGNEGTLLVKTFALSFLHSTIGHSPETWRTKGKSEQQNTQNTDLDPREKRILRSILSCVSWWTPVQCTVTSDLKMVSYLDD